ncbi:hypothetical protein BJ878DRAFT_530332 [Calycina marina]|uniref:Uncharacterized protein n=1 Tax=Calycina marina TaxID=1763456 RepID=A0A9P7YU72_9HELO|nr:hypothetical protein BJ878DRAFT_530332 [Calycina marina]
MSVKTLFDAIKTWTRRIGAFMLVSAIYSLILTGCLVTPGVFLAEITSPQDLIATTSPGNTPQHDTTIRFNYFGICTKIDDADFSCSSAHTAKKTNLTSLYSDALIKDVFDLQNSISYLVPTVALVVFMFGLLTFFLWAFFSRRQQKFTIFDQNTKVERKVKMLHQATHALLWFSVALSLAASFSTTTTLLALRITSRIFSAEDTGRTVVTGITIQVLQWMLVTVSTVFAAYIQYWYKPSDAKAAKNQSGESRSDDALSETSPLTCPSPTFDRSKPPSMTVMFPPPPRY